ncbi:sensor histidine kinase [Micromonospora sp. CPCC 205539]|uniref:sensor histidine kinase n=1 Tax=Micromonospora sp. CPCC 205539 TaxID=3122408 RepID=UPI002FF2FBE8
MLAQPARWPASLRRLVGRHPLLVDGLLAAATVAVSLALGGQQPPAGLRPMDLLGYLLTGLLGALLVARQRAPTAVLVLYCGVWAGYIGLGYWPVVNSPGMLLALYTVAAKRRVRTAVAAAVLGAAVWVYAGHETPLVAVVQGVVWTAVIVWIGYGAGQLAASNQRLARLAQQLAYEQEQRARRAVVEERVRIARELHDVVAHHMSVISVQAGLARYVLVTDPETARAALGTVLDTSGEALDELRRLLSLLRLNADGTGEESGSYAPAPGLGQLDELVQRVRTAGVQVEVTSSGAVRPLPPGVDLCAYRVIQEGLTNVLKHAPNAVATVLLQFGHDRLTARVWDDGTPSPHGSGGADGHGLLGMRERAHLYGGTLTAGTRPDGGFEVVLTLPIPAMVDGERPTPGRDVT